MPMQQCRAGYLSTLLHRAYGEEARLHNMQAKETNTLLYVKDEYIKQLDSGEYTVKTDISCAQISAKKGYCFSH